MPSTLTTVVSSYDKILQFFFINGASFEYIAIYNSVIFQNQTAELHLSRFANGIRGNSIKYKDQWMTPQQFEEACGTNNHKYLENIQTDYGPLKTLTASGMLKPHSR